MSTRQVVRIALMAVTAMTFSLHHSIAEEETNAIEWLQHYGDARKESGETQRPVFLFLTTQGCPHCARMEYGTFKDSDIASTIKDSFVPARLKLNSSSSLARDLKVTLYPTTVLIAPDGKVLDYIRGYVGTERLRESMAMAVHKDTVASNSD